MRAVQAEAPPGKHARFVKELISRIYHGRFIDLPLPLSSLDFGYHIAAHSVTFGHDALQMHDEQGFQSFAAIISLKGYPQIVGPKLLHRLRMLPVEWEIAESCSIESNIWKSSRVPPGSQGRRHPPSAIAKHQLSILVRSSTLTTLDDAVGLVSDTLTDAGIIAVREDVGLQPAFWARFPGNQLFLTRPMAIFGRSLIEQMCFGEDHSASAAECPPESDGESHFEANFPDIDVQVRQAG